MFPKKANVKTYLSYIVRDGSRYQNGQIFGKVPNGLWPPPLMFQKLYCNFYYNGYKAFKSCWTKCKYVWGPDSIKYMHMISRERDQFQGRWRRVWDWGVWVNFRGRTHITLSRIDRKEEPQQWIWNSNWAQLIQNWTLAVDFQYTWIMVFTQK